VDSLKAEAPPLNFQILTQRRKDAKFYFFSL